MWIVKSDEGYLRDVEIGTYGDTIGKWSPEQTFARRYDDRNMAARAAYSLKARIVRLKTPLVFADWTKEVHTPIGAEALGRDSEDVTTGGVIYRKVRDLISRPPASDTPSACPPSSAEAEAHSED